MRRLLVLAAVACAALPASASAATVGVSAKSDNTFSPSSPTIAPGDTVRFTNSGGSHNVRFEDGQFEQPADPTPVWPDPVQRTFPSAGRFPYYCELHGGPDGAGMSGVVTVGTAGGGGGGPTVTPPPTVEALKARRLKGGAIKIRLRASAVATARVSLARRSRGRYRKLKTVKPKTGGDKTLTVTFRRSGGKPLEPGRYRVTVKLTDSNGNSGPSRSTKIRLR